MTQDEANLIFECVDGKVLYRPRIMSRGRESTLAGTEAGWDSGHGYRKIRYKKKTYYAHQLVYFMYLGYIPKLIDHIDGNGYNNTPSNLRECTKSQNAINAKTPSDNTSGVKNVGWSTQRNKWYCRLVINGKQKYFGFFSDLELAELVAREAREKYHGNFLSYSYRGA